MTSDYGGYLHVSTTKLSSIISSFHFISSLYLHLYQNYDIEEEEEEDGRAHMQSVRPSDQ